MAMNLVGIQAIVQEFARQFNNPDYTFAADNYINGPWGCTCIMMASPPIGVVNAIAISPATFSVALGNTVQLACTATTTLNTMFDCTKMVTWSVSPPKIGGVNANGVFTPNMVGTANVAAVYMQSGSPINSPNASATVTATAREAEEVAAAATNGEETPAPHNGVPPPVWVGLCGYYCLIGPIQSNTPVAPQIAPYVNALQAIITQGPKGAGLAQPEMDLKLAQEELQ